MGYVNAVTFHATDVAGVPIYHTNLVMAVGTGVAVVCSEAVDDADERRRLLQSLQNFHEVVEISRSQMGSFCGNVLEVEDRRGLPACPPAPMVPFSQSNRLRYCGIAPPSSTPLLTPSRTWAGGGVRCTLAEI